MRDDSGKWDAPEADQLVADTNDLTISQIQPTSQWLISGVNALQATRLNQIGWPGDIDSDAYALVLRRDRILEVNGPARSDGWDESTQCAVSDVTAGYAVFELVGAGALDMLKHGAFVDPRKPSGSVARQIFGIWAMLYRTSPDRYRIHIARMHAQAMRGQFKSHINKPDARPTRQ